MKWETHLQCDCWCNFLSASDFHLPLAIDYRVNNQQSNNNAMKNGSKLENPDWDTSGGWRSNKHRIHGYVFSVEGQWHAIARALTMLRFTISPEEEETRIDFSEHSLAHVAPLFVYSGQYHKAPMFSFDRNTWHRNS